jgi:hypothetical protein
MFEKKWFVKVVSNKMYFEIKQVFSLYLFEII